VVFLTGFVDPINYGERTVVSIANDTPIAGQQTLTVSGTALAVEANSIGKGMGLIDAARMFVDPVISNNVCTGQSQTPMLLASFTGSSSRINNNTISNQVGSDYVTAAAIEMIYMQPGLIVDYNVIGPTIGSVTTDNAGIFLDGGCNGVIVRNNTISNVIPGTLDNSGQGTAFFYATNCTVENNTLTNCYRGTWAGGTGGSGNIIRNNSYTNCDIGIDINCSVPIGVFDYRTGHTFSGNRIDIFSCPDNLTIYGAALNKGAGKAKKKKSDRERYIAKYKEQLYEFATLADLEDFVDEKKAEEADKPKKQRATIKIRLAEEFASEIEDEISVPPRLQYMPLGAAMAQVRRIDHSLETLIAKRVKEIDDDDEEAMLWLLI
jgi:hypothetical protein